MNENNQYVERLATNFNESTILSNKRYFELDEKDELVITDDVPPAYADFYDTYRIGFIPRPQSVPSGRCRVLLSDGRYVVAIYKKNLGKHVIACRGGLLCPLSEDVTISKIYYPDLLNHWAYGSRSGICVPITETRHRVLSLQHDVLTTSTGKHITVFKGEVEVMLSEEEIHVIDVTWNGVGMPFRGSKQSWNGSCMYDDLSQPCYTVHYFGVKVSLFINDIMITRQYYERRKQYVTGTKNES